MQVKIDTKEKFHVITPIEPVLSATMTDEIKDLLRTFIKQDVKNVVLDMSNIDQLDSSAAEQLLLIQKEFYEHSASFVTCAYKENITTILSDHELLELLNVAPTVSEGADIVQMEEIERELMDGDAFEEEKG
ncbi:MAG TPA: STAS domain-containing protein [Niabella sp.]|nr:STAS domain-containing protein [Niabella sp.]HOZ96711.1 STAS domain-containing protein [Niabella sp.]HQW14421.1 STAS domain-containing protein [Niabella sp.]HQX19836.1 STAS domain-containing protein [Niabella sp.]HQX40705.1 STAS domain-containing protein [Niabella sp.]